MYGHSYIYWAMKHALRTDWGRDLSVGTLATLEWKRRRGMLWPELLGLAVSSFEHAPPPQSNGSSLGGNDLTSRKGKSLMLQIIHDLQTLKDRFPSMYFGDIVRRHDSLEKAVMPGEVEATGKEEDHT